MKQLARLPEGSPLDYEPNNEQGVVYLFSKHARRFGLHIERIQSGFPDCIASKAGQRIRIEFEYRSRNFAMHRHNARACDWVVCWIHDWPAAPSRLRVVELRRQYGLGFNVWFQPVRGYYGKMLGRIDFSRSWSVPPGATEGNLLLFYHSAPDSWTKDIFELAGPVRHCTAGWKPGKDWMGPIRRVCALKSPIHLSDLRQHRVIRNAGFVRGGMRGRYKASAYWPELYELIIARNPSAAHALQRFTPARLE